MEGIRIHSDFLQISSEIIKILSIKLSIKLKLTELSIWPFMCAREMEKEERAIQDSVKIGNRTILVKKKKRLTFSVTHHRI